MGKNCGQTKALDVSYNPKPSSRRAEEKGCIKTNSEYSNANTPTHNYRCINRGGTILRHLLWLRRDKNGPTTTSNSNSPYRSLKGKPMPLSYLALSLLVVVTPGDTTKKCRLSSCSASEAWAPKLDGETELY